MPEVANVNDLYQVRVKGFQEQQETNNVMHFKCTVASADVELELIQALIACYIETLLPGLSAAWTLDTVVWKRVSPTLGPDFITVPGVASAGAIAGDALPTFNAALLSIRTAEGGRSKRGRMFLAGLPETGTTGSSIAVAQPTWAAILAFAACLVSKFIELEDIGVGKFRLGVYSRKLGGSAFPYGAAGFSPAVTVSPVVLVATMRSRKVGRGS